MYGFISYKTSPYVVVWHDPKSFTGRVTKSVDVAGAFVDIDVAGASVDVDVVTILATTPTMSDAHNNLASIIIANYAPAVYSMFSLSRLAQTIDGVRSSLGMFVIFRRLMQSSGPRVHGIGAEAIVMHLRLNVDVRFAW